MPPDCLGEEQDGSGDSGIGLEHAAQAANQGQALILDEHLAQTLVCVARSEEDPVRHDDGGTSAGFE